MDWLSPQLPSIVALQKIGGLAPAMKFFSLLGNEEFFLLLLPLIYWAFDRKNGRRLGVLLLVGDAFNIILKVAFAQPRPYWLMAYIKPLASETTFGFPSSHAQNVAAIWPFLALQFQGKKRALFLFLAVVLVGLVGLSRVYLGVHFPSDVIAGVLIGFAGLAIFCQIVSRAEKWFAEQTLGRQIGIAIGIAALILVSFEVVRFLDSEGRLWPFAANARSGQLIISRAGAILGLLVGLAIAARKVPFETNAPIFRKIARCIIGFIGVLLIWRGLALVFPSQPEPIALVFRFVRYALTTFWVVCGAPYLFARLEK